MIIILIYLGYILYKNFKNKNLIEAKPTGDIIRKAKSVDITTIF